MNEGPHFVHDASSDCQRPRVDDLLGAALSDLEAVNVELYAAMQLLLPPHQSGELQAALSRAAQRASSCGKKRTPPHSLRI